MDDFDIKSQLDLLNDYLDKEMEGVKSEYFVVKSDNKGSHDHTSTIVDGGDLSKNGTNGSLPYVCSVKPPPQLYPWPADRSNHVFTPQTVVKKPRSRAIDIIDPETGEKLQL